MLRKRKELPLRQQYKLVGINKTPLYVLRALELAFEQLSCTGVSILSLPV
jgi:hypothetical protein